MPTVPPAPRTSALVARELVELLGHRPAEADDALAGRGVEIIEELDVIGDSLGLGRLVVERHRRRAVALDPEVAVVVPAGHDAEPLGQTTAPGALLAGGLVVLRGERCRSVSGRPRTPTRRSCVWRRARPRRGRRARRGAVPRSSSARSTVSRLAFCLMAARPTRTQGVPPMRSSVEKVNPLSLPSSRAWVTSTHSSDCFVSAPISCGKEHSAERSAISSSSTSLSPVQSLVSTSIDIRAVAPVVRPVGVHIVQSSNGAPRKSARQTLRTPPSVTGFAEQRDPPGELGRDGTASRLRARMEAGTAWAIHDPDSRSHTVSTGPRLTGRAEAWWTRCVPGVMTMSDHHPWSDDGRTAVWRSACHALDTAAQTTTVPKSTPVMATAGKVTRAVTGNHDCRHARLRSYRLPVWCTWWEAQPTARWCPNQWWAKPAASQATNATINSTTGSDADDGEPSGSWSPRRQDPPHHRSPRLRPGSRRPAGRREPSAAAGPQPVRPRRPEPQPDVFSDDGHHHHQIGGRDGDVRTPRARNGRTPVTDLARV